MDGSTGFRNLSTREKRRAKPPTTRSLQSDEQLYGGRTQCGGGHYQSRETNGERASPPLCEQWTPDHHHSGSRRRPDTGSAVRKTWAGQELSCQACHCPPRRDL